MAAQVTTAPRTMANLFDTREAAPNSVNQTKILGQSSSVLSRRCPYGNYVPSVRGMSIAGSMSLIGKKVRSGTGTWHLALTLSFASLQIDARVASLRSPILRWSTPRIPVVSSRTRGPTRIPLLIAPRQIIAATMVSVYSRSPPATLCLTLFGATWLPVPIFGWGSSWRRFYHTESVRQRSDDEGGTIWPGGCRT